MCVHRRVRARVYMCVNMSPLDHVYTMYNTYNILLYIHAGCSEMRRKTTVWLSYKIPSQSGEQMTHMCDICSSFF